VQVEAGKRVSSSMAEVEEHDVTVVRNVVDDGGWEDVGAEDAAQGHGGSKSVLAGSASCASSMRFL
jgi:hypothetical protein